MRKVEDCQYPSYYAPNIFLTLVKPAASLSKSSYLEYAPTEALVVETKSKASINGWAQ